MIPRFPAIPSPNSNTTYKASLATAIHSPDNATGTMAFSLSFQYSDPDSPCPSSLSSSFSSTSSSSSMPPPPPPTTPNNDILDITPRKCSFSSYFSSTPRTNSICAFPSWPIRSSLLLNGSDCARESVASSYLSDEDLLPGSLGADSLDSGFGADVSVGPVTRIPFAAAATTPTTTTTFLTTEQQIEIIRAAIEEEKCRARFLAQVRAHQPPRMTRDVTTGPPISGKRRSRPDKRRPRLGPIISRGH